MSNNNKGYYYGLDFLRAALMLIGVLIHSSELVNTRYQWDFHSSQYHNNLIHDVVYITHFFRMQTFFLIAGFFSAMVLIKKGKQYFWHGRINRVFIPLVSAIVFLNTFEVWFITDHGIRPWSEISLKNFIVHAWFLLTLFILSALCFLPVDKWLDWFGKQKILTQLCLTVFYMLLPYGIRFVCMHVISTEDSPIFYTLLNYLVERTLSYSIYFFLGYQIYRSQYLQNLLNNNIFQRLTTIVSIVGLAFLYNMIETEFSGKHSMVYHTFMLLTIHTTALATSWALFGYFANRVNIRPSRLLSMLVRSAIIIYLFHHPLVIVVGYYLDVPGLSAWSYFLLATALVYFFSFMCYFIINSNPLTRKMFGIK